MNDTLGMIGLGNAGSALAGALARLIRNPQERARLGAAGADRVRARFTMTAGIDALAARLGPPPPAQAAE